jgi:integrase
LNTSRALAQVRLIDNFYIFPGDKPGTRRSDLPKGWECFLKEAKIEDFHYHDLRHTCASCLVMAGADLNRVREILGHADITMTLQYAHLAPDHLKAAIRVPDAQPAPLALGIS